MRPAQSAKSPEHSAPANKITRSVVGDDVQKHFEALSRRIIELEDEKNRLQQELKAQKLTNDAVVEKCEQKFGITTSDRNGVHVLPKASRFTILLQRTM